MFSYNLFGEHFIQTKYKTIIYPYCSLYSFGGTLLLEKTTIFGGILLDFYYCIFVVELYSQKNILYFLVELYSQIHYNKEIHVLFFLGGGGGTLLPWKITRNTLVLRFSAISWIWTTTKKLQNHQNATHGMHGLEEKTLIRQHVFLINMFKD